MKTAIFALTNDELTGVCICCGEDSTPCRECGRDVCRVCNPEQEGLCYDCNKEAERIAQDIAQTDRQARENFYRFNR